MDPRAVSDNRYQGDGRIAAAWNGLTAAIGGPALVITACAAFDKATRGGSIFGHMQRVWSGAWGGALAAITGLAAVVGAYVGYHRAGDLRDRHNRLVGENLVLRTQLDQTGMALNQIADNLTRGGFAAAEGMPAASHAEQALSAKEAAAPATPSVG